jgi:cell division control protein 24
LADDLRTYPDHSLKHCVHAYRFDAYVRDLHFVQSGTMDPPVMNGGPVIAEDNIINRKAGQDQSLYQICINLRRRLGEVPGFEHHLQEMTVEEEDPVDGEATDPVTSMWRLFRKGYPLMTAFNASNPEVPLDVDVQKVGEAKIGKAATFKFLHACMTEFRFLPQDCFLITDLYTDDTNGFVKVGLFWF